MYIKVYHYDYTKRQLEDKGFYLNENQIVFIITKTIDYSSNAPLISNGKKYWPITTTSCNTVGIYYIGDEDFIRILNLPVTNARY